MKSDTAPTPGTEVWLNVRLGADEKAAVAEIAERNERTLAGQVRLFIRDGLEREKAAA